MRWYFKKNGWPTSTVLQEAPKNEEEEAKLVDTLQDWKSAKFRDFIGSGSVKPRPGIIEVTREAKVLSWGLHTCLPRIFLLDLILDPDICSPKLLEVHFPFVSLLL